ncbi:hypothetical protein [Micromonospora sp. NBC_01796]|nr:hypothetical protein [Micromonospora sp. NBC_01796]WSA85830.1 hypothetical protein OIE47_36730 [Micromonospora sp. NBC_01796]
MIGSYAAPLLPVGARRVPVAVRDRQLGGTGRPDGDTSRVAKDGKL